MAVGMNGDGQSNVDQVFSILLRFPRSKIMEKELYDLDQPLNKLLECGKDKLYTMCYKLLILDIVCHRNNDEWRQRFLEKKGFDILLKIFHRFTHKDHLQMQVYELGMAILLKILYYFCCSSKLFATTITKHVFIKKALVPTFSMWEMPNSINYGLIFLICVDAIDRDSMQILDIIPRIISEIQIKPLMLGYIKECQIGKNIPNEIVSILCCFF